MELRYFRDVDKREVDFVIVKDRNPIHFVECKLSEENSSISFEIFILLFNYDNDFRNYLQKEAQYRDCWTIPVRL